MNIYQKIKFLRFIKNRFENNLIKDKIRFTLINNLNINYSNFCLLSIEKNY